ncbi:tyrosine-type recombinase/integrase [Alphaproteobacteria bacterium endosymbiont of Tiliacea citrago]|uniref:tyrosine-type recombinase/integrase n=1 Tax=Alphaproteobacteria bacterium endosymbiont of Tiliacea citrago TaxID=3077944 RepID=UPI00313BD4D1
MVLEDWISSFLWVLRVEKRISLNSYKSYFYDFKIFSDWILFYKKDIFNEDLVSEYFLYLKNERKNLEPSIDRKINLLISFFKFCNQEKGASFVIKDRKKERKNKIYRPFLEGGDLLKIRSFLSCGNDFRLAAIVEVLYSTGLRISELLKLRCVDLHEIKKNKSLQIVGKGGGKRVVFFSSSSILFLDQYVFNMNFKNEYLFNITRQRVFQLLKNLGVALNIDLSTVFPHSFRHRLLTDLVKNGMNLVSVQKIAGHKQISTTEKYTHVEDFLYEEIYKFHPLVKKFS